MKHQYIFWMSQSSNVLDTKVYFKETNTHELPHKKYFNPKRTFQGILKLQLIRFLTICNNMEDFHEATSILFKCSVKNDITQEDFLDR